MIHPATGLKEFGGSIGLGLVARQQIPKGTLIWVRDPLDQILPARMVADLPPLYADLTLRFAYRNRQNDYILPWDDTRFMNHSCEHNCVPTPFDFEIAIRDIAAGEQLTNDYAMLNLEPDERLECCCGTPSCRKIIGPEDQHAQAPQWQKEVRAALACSEQVPQALMSLLPAEQLHAAFVFYHVPGEAVSKRSMG